ncbi:MAG: peptide deformylase [Chloroflexi bacterium]|nr:peptide deformylase [Chloroflexota bacterium]MBU1660400.1 peptide deformylase [Chloroflexota bacterium]
MPLREIITTLHPTLRRTARKVTDFGPQLQILIDDMVEIMREAPGVGLAAPQVNISLQVIVVEFGDEEDETVLPKLYTLVNPEISRPSRDLVTGTEGCLSVPGLVGDVERSYSVTVNGLNRRGQPVKIKAKGWLSRIFQHEVDHLRGILFTDHALRVWEPVTEEEKALID